MKCPNCGANLPNGAKYCHVCEENITESTSQKTKRPKVAIIVTIITAVVLIFIFLPIIAIGYNNNKVSDVNTANTETTSDVVETTILSTQPVTDVIKITEECFKEDSIEIDYSTLERNPKKYIDQYFKFTGEVYQVVEPTTIYYKKTELLIDVSDDQSGDTIFATIELPEGSDRILEGDNITFWGICQGLTSYKSISGKQISVPNIEIYYYEIN